MNDKRSLPLACGVAALLLFVVGCSGPVEPTSPPTPVPLTSTPVPPTPTPIPPSPAGPTMLFQDDFSDPSSGWVEGSTANYSADYLPDGRLVTAIAKGGLTTWSKHNLNLGDLDLAVDASLQLEPSEHTNQMSNIYGIIVRFQDPKNFYLFGINHFGQSFALKIEAGKPTSLGGEKIAGFDSGSLTHRIRVTAKGADFRLYVDDQRVMDVSDGTFRTGDIALVLMAQSGPGAVSFDNAELWVGK